jgi:hypothetical protein
MRMLAGRGENIDTKLIVVKSCSWSQNEEAISKAKN